ncbi:MAG: cofactor-independent phosphoglycerate mutase [Deltaproteobacteria bacterium]|jgi:2,3-bisphosphoglycerate-independent phosphoglycerate mutase|nr:cofactor-independent phosphoglycerate mutase [Deltaproteobacteria bacterium]
MKYLILIGDGMGDRPIDSLGGLTPLAYAKTPNMDRLAREGQLGLARTAPEGMKPGSDVCIMSLMGFDPQGALTGRGPLEALALGVPLNANDLAFRLNLITMEIGPQTIIRDHAAGDIGFGEARELLEALKGRMPLTPGQSIHQGFSYRNVFVWPDAPDGLDDIPPHDMRDRSIDHALNDPGYRPIADLVRASWPILADHPVNQRRIKANLHPGNSIWLWGQGYKPNVKTYLERWGLTGVTVSAVDIIKGLGLATGLKPMAVEGLTGGLDTNYAGKVGAALSALADDDLALVHYEAPDETSHQGELGQKIQAIESFDRLIVGPILEGLHRAGLDYRLILACDHYTPIEIKTHSIDPVPFILYDSRGLEPQGPRAAGYSETEAAKTGYYVPDGPTLGRAFFGPEKSH